MAVAAIPILKVHGISKSFGNVQALKNVEFELYPGEVHALMGENGAGKSTMGKIIAGIYSADQGVIELSGKEVQINTPADAIANGIAIVMQELSSMPHLPVYENIFLGHKEIFKHGVILDKAQAVRRTKELLTIFDMQNQISPYAALGSLTVAERQIVEIIKAVSYDSRIIILDEPTAGQDYEHYTEIMEFLKELNGQGYTIVMITHDMHLMLEYTSRAIVFSEGQLLADTSAVHVLNNPELVRQANLKETSLYTLSVNCGIDNPQAFTECFIRHEQEVR